MTVGKKYLVAGGAGYVGSHLVRLLRARGASVVVLDNLATGHAFLAGDATLVQADLLDAPAVRAVFDAHGPFDAVLHFAALSLVGESVREPERYRRNNVDGTRVLLDAMRATGHRRLVFSSTAAVYGIPARTPIPEDHPQHPVNPYGETKLAVEAMLRGHAADGVLDSVALRYFNAAGAHPGGVIGEWHEPETHLVPNVLRAAFTGGSLSLFGDDYPTPDGTCIRDYVHVDDLADAHLRALDFLGAHPGAHAFNLGNGNGFSVREVVAAAERATGQRVAVQVMPRRPGDPAVLVADATRARRELGWQPAWTRLEDIVASAVPFFRARVLARGP